MIKPIVTMSQDEQDNHFCIVMDKLQVTPAKKRELQTLMATIYLNGSVSSYMTRKICPSNCSNEDAINELRKAGASIEYQGNNFVLKGFDDGEKCMMHFKNTHAPHIKLSR